MKAEYDAKCKEIDGQPERLKARPAPLLQQQQSVLESLVDNWAAMSADERKRLLASIFDSVTATAEGWTVWSRAPTGSPTWSRPFLSRNMPNDPDRGQQSGRRDSMSPMLKQLGSFATNAGGSG
jgi:hypothetical protein